jgi:polar amino acid transport system substrate-binding protein
MKKNCLAIALSTNRRLRPMITSRLLPSRRAFGLLAVFFCVVFAVTVLAAEGNPEATDKADNAQKLRDIQVGPKPDWSWLPQLRVLTEADYPPFNYYDEEGRLIGFNIDLARAICRELSIDCDISAAEWSTLVPSLKANEADAVIASMAINGKTIADVDFTNRYYMTPARFVGRTGALFREVSVEALKGEKVAVVRGSAHEAFLRDFFDGARIMSFDTAADARGALKAGDVDLLFGDGISLMFWIQGTDANRCCEFKGGGYTEARYFGDGIGIAVKKGNTRLREVLDYALARVKASGRYEELMLRYFPLPLY